MGKLHMAPSSGPGADRLLGFRITPIARRRLQNFRRNQRGYWSLWIFCLIFFATLFAELLANDKPLLIWYDGAPYFPVAATYPETVFGGEFELEADYRDPFIQELITDKGWMVWPLIPFSYDTQDVDLPVPGRTRAETARTSIRRARTSDEAASRT